MRKLQAQIMRARNEGVLMFCPKCPMATFYRDKLGKMPCCLQGRYVPRRRPPTIHSPGGSFFNPSTKSEMVFQPGAVCPNYKPGSIEKGAGEQDYRITCNYTDNQAIEGDVGKKAIF